MDVFEQCKQINNLLTQNKEQEARNKLIILLQELKDSKTSYTPLVNHMIREVGLYPYIDKNTSDWQERFVVEAFKVDAGSNQDVVLHREQSAVLKALLNGEDLAISAPTSFGKSFIIDTFIEIKKPSIVVIIVPTIALTDETRRRLCPKFASEYKIITTTGVTLGKKNLFIFPQERALQYVDEIEHIDLLIVDEFYKAGKIKGKNNTPDERASQLIEAIYMLSKKSVQRYFLAPNISELTNNPFTKGMRFETITFNTVYTNVVKKYTEISGNKKEKETQKFACLKSIIETTSDKSIIYVNSHASIKTVAENMYNFCDVSNCSILHQFSSWLKEHYGKDYALADLVRKGIGIHSGRLHRSLSQIQIKLFEQSDGLKNLISTSSLIEGVNTSAKNIIVWSNKNATAKYDYFTYMNIVGRSGRMFKHFVGDVYLLECPPEETSPSLELDFPDSLLDRIDPKEYSGQLTPEQIAKIKENEAEMDRLLGDGEYRQMLKGSVSQGVSKPILIDIIKSMRNNTAKWKRSLPGLLDTNTSNWRNALFLMMPLLRKTKNFQRRYTTIVQFIQTLSKSWQKTIPQLLGELASDEISVEDYFEFEKLVSFNFVSLLRSINVISKRILLCDVDITPFITKVSNLFLPPLVFQLEEYGLPRMLSRKLHNSRVIDLERVDISINDVLDEFLKIGMNRIIETAQLSAVDQFILSYFFEGITPLTTP